MSIDEHPTSRLPLCGSCSYRNEPDDRFCARCGAAMGSIPQQRHQPPGTRPPAAPPQVDGTTRYLCAAAHLDPAFADAAIAEHLVERTRAIAPSPGVDSAAVLRDAVAARARCRLRDTVLIVLLLAALVTSPQAVVAWLIVGLVATVLVPGTGDASRWRTLVTGVVVVLVMGFLATVGMNLLYLSGLDVSLGGDAQLVVLLLLAAAVAAVCLLDEALVDGLVRDRFRPSQFAPAVALRHGWERTVRSFGTGPWEADLERVAKADEQGRRARGQADVIVYRERVPFVGSGRIVEDHVVALPLTPGTGSDGEPLTPTPFVASELHAYVASVVEGLRESGSLSPARRLSAMTVREQVLVPAERLVTNLHRQPHPPVLPGLGGPPVTHLPVEEIRHLADRPEEWARYYRCFRVEAWDRDLATSTYFAAGVDSRMLYLEWTHCLLRPLKEQYRRIDRTPRVGPILRGLFAAVALPVTAFERLGRVVHVFRPLPQRQGEVVPDRYGAGTSLRELASDRRTQDFFQDADAIRYVRIIERALFRAVGRFLEERGYSVVDFMEAAKASIITNNSVSVTGGHITGGLAMGIGTVGQQTHHNGPSGPTKEKS